MIEKTPQTQRGTNSWAEEEKDPSA